MKTERKQSTGEDAQVIFNLQARSNKEQKVSQQGSDAGGSCRARPSLCCLPWPCHRCVRRWEIRGLCGHSSGAQGSSADESHLHARRLDPKHSLPPSFHISSVRSEVSLSVHFWCVVTASVRCSPSNLQMLSHWDNVLHFVSRPAWLTDLWIVKAR